MNGKLILLVEDDKRVQIFNKRLLEGEGFTVEIALTLAEARALVVRQPPSAIILDIGMPDGSGLDFLRELRLKSGVPVLLLTGYDNDKDIVKGFELGCDDYLPKPYTFEVLLARLKRLLKSAEHVLSPISYGSLTLDINHRRAYHSGKDLSLRQKEFALLLLFVQMNGKAVSGEYLYEKIWGQPIGGDKNALQVAISRLRKKLEISGMNVHYERGSGYMLE
ncbi:DNA-binding response regulator [Betaproteobacteria bacterium]|nr:DNA-binding response regulator [Betaproteobacteria bacterium]